MSTTQSSHVYVQTDSFRLYVGRNNTLHEEPFGFWFMWRPRPGAAGRFERIPCKWFLDFWFDGWRPHWRFT